MIETEQQRRWWFATHPEYSWNRTGQRGENQGADGNEESDSFSPEAVDAYVEESLKYASGPVQIALLEATKFWLGTEFASKSPEEQLELLREEDEFEDPPDDDWRSDEPSGHPAADRSSYDHYEDVLERIQDYERGLIEQARIADERGIEPDPHWALDLGPLKRIVTSPIAAFRAFLRRVGRDAVVSVTKRGDSRWRVGDDIWKPTPKGVEPAWTTRYQRHWKARASGKDAIEEWGAENVERMKRGRAPQRRNRETGELESMELHHHPVPRRHGGNEFIEVWPEEHARMDPYRRLKKR